MSEKPQFVAQKPEVAASSIDEEDRIAELIAELLYEQMKKKNPGKLK